MYDNYVQYQTNPEFEGQLSSLLDSKSTKRSSVHRYFAIKFNVFLLFPFEINHNFQTKSQYSKTHFI